MYHFVCLFLGRSLFFIKLRSTLESLIKFMSPVWWLQFQCNLIWFMALNKESLNHWHKCQCTPAWTAETDWLINSLSLMKTSKLRLELWRLWHYGTLDLDLLTVVISYPKLVMEDGPWRLIIIFGFQELCWIEMEESGTSYLSCFWI